MSSTAFISSPPAPLTTRRKPRGLLAATILTALIAPAAEAAPQVKIIAGTGTPGYSGDGGPAAKAQMHDPFGIARGPDGALYVCEFNGHVVRRIDEKGTISTIAGNGTPGYSGDGPTKSASAPTARSTSPT
jgi:hypothetical protein